MMNEADGSSIAAYLRLMLELTRLKTFFDNVLEISQILMENCRVELHVSSGDIVNFHLIVDMPLPRARVGVLKPVPFS